MAILHRRSTDRIALLLQYDGSMERNKLQHPQCQGLRKGLRAPAFPAAPPFARFSRGGALFASVKMAASCRLFEVWRHRLSLGVPARGSFWVRQKKKDQPAVVEPSIPVKDVCPPPRSKKYLPPEDLQGRLESHVREIGGSSVSSDWQKTSLADFSFKYRLLAQMAADLGHTVPNNYLHQMKSVKDVLDFYNTPVKDISKLDELGMQDLPSNLKISWEYEVK